MKIYRVILLNLKLKKNLSPDLIKFYKEREDTI